MARGVVAFTGVCSTSILLVVRVDSAVQFSRRVVGCRVVGSAVVTLCTYHIQSYGCIIFVVRFTLYGGVAF